MIAAAAFTRRLVPGLWAGALLCVALIATPAPFAALDAPTAGRVVARILAQEAWLSLGLGGLLLMLARRAAVDAAESGAGSQFSTEMALSLGALFCTVAGYFALQPLMEAARAGLGALSFGQLHAISFGLFAVKIVLVCGLAVQAARRRS